MKKQLKTNENQSSSIPFTNNQWKAGVARESPRKTTRTCEHPEAPMGIYQTPWKWTRAHGNPRKMNACGNPYKSMTSNERLWKSMQMNERAYKAMEIYEACAEFNVCPRTSIKPSKAKETRWHTTNIHDTQWKHLKHYTQRRTARQNHEHHWASLRVNAHPWKTTKTAKSITFVESQWTSTKINAHPWKSTEMYRKRWTINGNQWTTMKGGEHQQKSDGIQQTSTSIHTNQCKCMNRHTHLETSTKVIEYQWKAAIL
jgi:hypothetical protein